MAPTAVAHHHRSTTKASHKPFKSRHATKGLLKDLSKGKVEDQGKRKFKSLHQQVMSKIERRHQARQKLQTKHQEHTKSTSVFAGINGAPRIVAIVPLTKDGDSKAAVQKLNDGLDVQADLEGKVQSTVRIDRFKQSIQYIPVQRDLLSVLDACRVADFVVFILSSTQEVDSIGELILRTVEGQGVTNVYTVVQALDTIDPPKRRPQILTSLKSYITHFFPIEGKISSLDSQQDCANVIRSLCTTTPKGIKWREDRSWMVIEDLQWQSDSESDQTGLVLTGVVRGKPLKANRLVEVGGWGTFQIEKISQASVPKPRKRKADEMAVEDTLELIALDTPDADQDDLAELAPDAVIMEESYDAAVSEAPTERRGVLLDDHHYFSEDEKERPQLPNRLPRGTSTYQAAWYLGDVSDSGSDIDDTLDVDGDVEMNSAALPQDGLEGLDKSYIEPTEAAMSEYPQSEMFLDPSPVDEAEELAAYRSRKKTEADDDLEFPDEIELHPNVLARERLARYRGLKSLRTSQWETDDDKAHEPENWNRLLRVKDYKAAKNKAVREALIGGVPPGTRVHVHLNNVPVALKDKPLSGGLVTLFSLLRHEHKRTVMNFNITLNSDCPNPIKSKEELIMQCGPRRFVVNPLFSQTGNTSNNVHKFDRYLHPGRTAMATVIAPLTWGAVPTLFFKRKAPAEDMPDTMTQNDDSDLELIATGTSQPPDHFRIIAKRIILTGHPYKIHKKLVTIRYMFFNKEDVHWFKALQLWTKRGRSGYIKESLGTHGYFKATFDARINPQDSIGVSMYKRVFPREAKPWIPGGLENKMAS
jgi:pre-rRNA-processing protein TSR1